MIWNKKYVKDLFQSYYGISRMLDKEVCDFFRSPIFFYFL